MNGFQVVAHRGAKGYFLENTLLAFEKAIEMGSNGIELDVHLSKDANLVVIHDETIDRTTAGSGKVSEFSLEDLQKFPIENKQFIPSLQQVFELINRKCFINIELKSQGTAEKVIDLIDFYVKEKRWIYEDFLVSSFTWEYLEIVNNRNPNIKIGVLTESHLESVISFAKAINAFSINPYYRLLTKENCKFMKQQNFNIFAWTVNEIVDIQKLVDMGVDAIITDFPDRVLNLGLEL
jgi:glycerophosphoryl diester phosphodiesterase